MNKTVALSKQFYRDYFKKRRDSVKSDEADNRIFEFLVNSEVYKNAESVFTYYSVGSEVDTHRIIDIALKDNKKVALPKCIDRNGTMEFYFIENTD